MAESPTFDIGIADWCEFSSSGDNAILQINPETILTENSHFDYSEEED